MVSLRHLCTGCWRWRSVDGATNCGCASLTHAGIVFRTSKSSMRRRRRARTGTGLLTTAGIRSPSGSARCRPAPVEAASTSAWTSTVGRWLDAASTTFAYRGRRRPTSTICRTYGSVRERPLSPCSRQAAIFYL